MQYRKDRCGGCGRPETGRPRNLRSKYCDPKDVSGYLESDGAFVTLTPTHFWFCSDECYENAFSVDMNKEYTPDKGTEEGKTIPPGLQKRVSELIKEIYERTSDFANTLSGDAYDRFINQFKIEAEKLKQEEIEAWQREQFMAIRKARYELSTPEQNYVSRPE